MITKSKLLKLIEESVPDNHTIDVSLRIDSDDIADVGNAYTVHRLEIKYLVKGMFPKIINTEG